MPHQNILQKYLRKLPIIYCSVLKNKLHQRSMAAKNAGNEITGQPALLYFCRNPLQAHAPEASLRKPFFRFRLSLLHV